MALFIKIMGLTWLLAEGLIMVFVRRGARFLETGATRQHGFLLFCTVIYLAVVLLVLGRTPLLNYWPEGASAFLTTFYDSYLWNLQCTLWAIIEGVIVINLFKAYQLLRHALDRQQYRPSPLLRCGPGVFYLLLLTGFGWYHFFLGGIAGQYHLKPEAIRNILTFYIKICGVFWIIIEGAVAVIAVKAVLLLKRRCL